MAHGFLCTCKKCNPGIFDSLFSGSKKSGNSFSKSYTDNKTGKRNTIYGDKRNEGRPGYRHGHDWQNGGRTPHSTIGHYAVDKTTGSKNRGHRYGGK